MMVRALLLRCFVASILLLSTLSPVSAAVSGTKGALVMLVSLTDAPIDCTVGEVRGMMFTNSPLNVDSFYDHATWGSVRWTGTVISVSIPFAKSPCQADAWANAADAAASAQGVNLASYTAKVYALPSAASSCGYAFAAGNRVWNFHCSDLFAYGHEIGHTIGMHHASTDRNNDGVIEEEYGGLDDCMGGESYTFNAPHKIWGGWLPQKAANGGWRTITANGNYSISPLEINPATNPQFSQALKIVPPTGNPYFLSYRQPLDFDRGWTATQVGKDGRSGTINDPVPPISAYPFDDGVTLHRHSGGTGAQTLEIAVLGDNQQFVIPGTGIIIRQLNHNTNQVTLSITGFGGGTVPSGVTFFQDALFGGAQSQQIPPGSYTLQSLGLLGLPNDWASSVKVPQGWTVTLYQHDNFGGTAWVLTTNSPNLGSLGANDEVSSVRIVGGPATVPPVPTDLSAVGSNRVVNLSWTATPGATGYLVRRSTVSGGPYTVVGAPALSAFADTSVSNGVTYFYVVAATNSVGSSANSSQVSASAVLDLIAHWKFDEGAGLTAIDSSGNNNSGALVNNPTRVTGRLGPGALQFSAGSLQYVNVAHSSSLNSPTRAITISAWINPIDWSGNRRILQKGNGDNQYRLLAEFGQLRFHLNGVDTLSAPLPPLNTWVHIAATWDGSTMVLYTNGVAQVSSGAGGTITSTGDPLAIARKSGSGVSGDYFNGRLDDVRLYNRALSGPEIGFLMSNSPPAFLANPFIKPSVVAGQLYAQTIATNASDPNGDSMTFSKVSGPAWLSVALTGQLSGTPNSSNVGTNSFVVRVSDAGGLSGTATLNITVFAGPSIVSSVERQGTNIHLTWSGGIPPYQVQAITHLSSANWLNVGGLNSGNSLLIAPTNPFSFFRVVGQ